MKQYGASVTLTATTSGTPTAYVWNLWDGSSIVSTTNSIQKVVNQATDAFTVTAVDAFGQKSSQTGGADTITVPPSLDGLAVEAPPLGVVPYQVSLQAEITLSNQAETYSVSWLDSNSKVLSTANPYNFTVTSTQLPMFLLLTETGSTSASIKLDFILTGVASQNPLVNPIGVDLAPYYLQSMLNPVYAVAKQNIMLSDATTSVDGVAIPTATTIPGVVTPISTTVTTYTKNPVTGNYDIPVKTIVNVPITLTGVVVPDGTVITADNTTMYAGVPAVVNNAIVYEQVLASLAVAYAGTPQQLVFVTGVLVNNPVLTKVTIQNHPRILAVNQTDQTQNGIYLSGTGVWQRDADALALGAVVSPIFGNSAGQIFAVIGDSGPSGLVIGTNNIVFAQVIDSYAGYVEFSTTDLNQQVCSFKLASSDPNFIEQTGVTGKAPTLDGNGNVIGTLPSNRVNLVRRLVDSTSFSEGIQLTCAVSEVDNASITSATNTITQLP